METRILKIDEDTKLDRLDKVLAEKLDFSRKRIKDLLDEGNVLVNQKVMKASYKVCIGDEIEVSIPELDSTQVLPEPIDLDIVYEDHDIIVINKPKGMVVHPAPGHYSGTLVNALLYHCKDLSGINGVMRPGIVHRIDKDTSGLLVVAKNDVAHEALSQQLQDKTCHREYVAIVHKPFTHEYGTIHAPIGRDEKDRQKMAVTANNSKDAITHFTVLENFKKFLPGDTRRDVTLKDVYNKVENGELELVGLYPHKYWGVMNGSTRVRCDDYPIYRYSDLLLMLAEAKVLLGEDPATEINRVRRRAFGDAYDASTVGFPNQEVDKRPADAVLQERLFEFMLEGKRWYDLRRFGDSYVLDYTPAEPARLLWAINQGALTNNPLLKQTVGY